MAAKATESKDALLDQETWIEMLYQLLNDIEIRKIATVVQPKIQGFTTKNTVKAHPKLLRKKTIEQLRQNKNIMNWMKKWYEPTVSKVKESNIEFEQFCHKIKFGEGVTPAESVALTGILYPEMFNAHKDSIQKNLSASKHPLENLSIKKLTLKKELQVKALAWEDSMSAESYSMLIEKLLQSLPVIEGSVKEWIQKKQAVEMGELAYVASTRMDEISKWPEGEKAAFLQMAFHDSQKVLWKMIDDLLKEKNEQDKEDKAKGRRLKKLEKQSAEREELEAVRKAQAVEQEKKLLDNNQHYERTIAELQAEINALKQWQALEEEAAAALVQEVPLLLTESDFILLTRFNPEEFAGMIPINQIFSVENIERLHGAQLMPGTQYLFIHSDRFSTKEQFELDEFAAMFQIPYKSVSGDFSAVTRQLIYYLEGAILHEINP
ncbi:hypothetical protein FHS16_005139 [Paenibacillus endophyticus]|uniref:Uncharacterized protein n=1 Tax=Paenibacillus endophyticus TaxID=1294268 RepID=A0A7W5CCE2_9BACL|nr:hypothetical protein [Paenibacillus endophyticus]MBB3155032.1 hypothetical protein [Paenibacillus endophyticus]